MERDPGEAPSERARLRQRADRGTYDREAVHEILDAGVVAHVGLVRDGTPVVVPMAYGRVGDTLYLHGGNASRLLRALAEGAAACVTVTLIDGLVLARSAFKHSMNYRSVVAHGAGRPVTDPDEALAALRAVTDHNVPGRWDALRPLTRRELAATTVVAFPLAESGAKVRDGGPVDPPEDLGQPVWAGVIPLRLTTGDPVPAAGVADLPPPRPRSGLG